MNHLKTGLGLAASARQPIFVESQLT